MYWREKHRGNALLFSHTRFFRFCGLFPQGSAFFTLTRASPTLHTMSGAPIAAAKMFAARGAAAARANPATEIAVGLTLGIAGGMAFKMWHWGERKKVEEYYRQLNGGK